MLCLTAGIGSLYVALLAEGVDRNKNCVVAPAEVKASPSSRRAWIEISRFGSRPMMRVVALLAEGVDRNRIRTDQYIEIQSRPPRGGRG